MQMHECVCRPGPFLQIQRLKELEYIAQDVKTARSQQQCDNEGSSSNDDIIILDHIKPQKLAQDPVVILHKLPMINEASSSSAPTQNGSKKQHANFVASRPEDAVLADEDDEVTFKKLNNEDKDSGIGNGNEEDSNDNDDEVEILEVSKPKRIKRVLPVGDGVPQISSGTTGLKRKLMPECEKHIGISEPHTNTESQIELERKQREVTPSICRSPSKKKEVDVVSQTLSHPIPARDLPRLRGNSPYKNVKTKFGL